MMSERDNFVARWSRRKIALREGDQPTEEQAPTCGDAQDQAVSDPPKKVASEGPALPDLESLDRHSDFSAFMRKGVPEALRKQALRKLWRLDPAFSKLDGLLEYGEDYNAPSRRPAVVRTAWRIGRGMAGPADEEAPPVTEASGETPAEVAGDKVSRGEPAAEPQPGSGPKQAACEEGSKGQDGGSG